jgi:hypothetical protein
MHPVVAGDHLTRIGFGEQALLKALKSGIRRTGAENGGTEGSRRCGHGSFSYLGTDPNPPIRRLQPSRMSFPPKTSLFEYKLRS